MKKSFQLLFFLITSLIILSGCSKIQDHVVIKEDGNIVREMVITIDKTDENYSEEAEKIALEKIKSEAEEQGYKYKEEDIISEGKKVIRISKLLEPADINNASIVLFEDEKKSSFTISKNEGFFTTNYITDGKIKVPTFKQGDKDLLTYQLNVHFPSKVSGEHNAGNVAEDKKTLSWKPDKNEEIIIQYDVSSYNFGNIYLVVGPVLVILLVAFYYYRKKNSPSVNRRRVPLKERK